MITDEGLYRKDVYAFEFHLRGLYKSHTNVVYGTRDWTQKSLRAARTMGPKAVIFFRHLHMKRLCQTSVGTWLVTL